MLEVNNNGKEKIDATLRIDKNASPNYLIKNVVNSSKPYGMQGQEEPIQSNRQLKVKQSEQQSIGTNRLNKSTFYDKSMLNSLALLKSVTSASLSLTNRPTNEIFFKPRPIIKQDENTGVARPKSIQQQQPRKEPTRLNLAKQNDNKPHFYLEKTNLSMNQQQSSTNHHQHGNGNNHIIKHSNSTPSYTSETSKLNQRSAGLARLKQMQRNQIYLLNDLMTNLEKENFIEFCRENNIEPHLKQ